MSVSGGAGCFLSLTGAMIWPCNLAPAHCRRPAMLLLPLWRLMIGNLLNFLSLSVRLVWLSFYSCFRNSFRVE